MRLGVALIALALMCAPFTWAQAPLPDSIVSANLSRAQLDELNRRLAVLQGRFNTLASETQLRENAVRNIAIEIFGARPDLDFETYAELIDSGARELRTLLTEARGRTEADPQAAAIRVQAIAAAEDGRLTEARTFYDQLIARTTETLEARWAREDRERETQRDAQRLAVAADMAEAARLAYVAADYFDAARRYGQAAERAPEGVPYRWGYRSLQANALRTRGEVFVDVGSLREAARIYRDEALPLAPRQISPQKWAASQNDLGVVLLRLGQMSFDVDPSDAIRAFRSAQEVYTRESAPSFWAAAQDNLGSALSLLGERGDAQARQDAVAAHRSALDVLSREAAPADWGNAQNNLGNALSELAERGDPQSLRDAIVAYRAALEVFPRESSPIDWARTQGNLANALSQIGATGDLEALRQAEFALRATLEVYSPLDTPASWAAAQNNLGNVLRYLGQQGDYAALSEAVSAYRSALEVRTREAAPIDWAVTQSNLGVAVTLLGRRGLGPNRGLDMLREGVRSQRSALEVLRRDSTPAQWAETQYSLANALRLLGFRDDGQGGGSATLIEAIGTYREALEVITADSHPALWALAQEGLGDALLILGERGDNEALSFAVSAYRAALDGAGSSQAKRGRLLNAICWTSSFVGERAETDQLAHQALTQGLRACEEALQVQTRQSSPEDWAATQDSLGRVYEILGDRGGGARSYGEALVRYRSALQVFTVSSDPQNYSATSESVARVMQKMSDGS